jgi:uncharacterized protein (UPF0548 family)
VSFTYPDVGAVLREPLPPGYRHLRVRHRLGHGDLRTVGEALVRFGVHRAAGVVVDADADRAAPGARVVTRLGIGPARIAMPCRVVTVRRGPDVVGFTYGTLPGHPFVGEEGFTVERDADGVLWFVVRAFSRPAWPVLRPLGVAVAVAQRVYAWRLARTARAMVHRRA